MTGPVWLPIDKPIPARRDRKIIADSGLAAGTLTQITAALPDVLARIHDATSGQPGAARTDTIRSSGHATVLDEHGIPMPAVSDPTGEAGIRPDPAAAAHNRIEQLAKRLLTDAEALLFELGPWLARAPLAKELRETERANTPGCESCARIDGPALNGVPWWNHPRTTVTLNLVSGERTKVRVCEWCEAVFRADGRLPTEAEVEDHRDGKRRMSDATAKRKKSA